MKLLPFLTLYMCKVFFCGDKKTKKKNLHEICCIFYSIQHFSCTISSCFHFFQSASVRFAPRDQWHYRSFWIFHKALWSPHHAVHKGVTLPAAQSWPHWDRHWPHGVRQALLPLHLQLHQTWVQKTFGNLLTTLQSQKNIHSSLIF